MTDRELLELAAKASKIKLVFPYGKELAFEDFHGGYVVWNPLTDDGDALRLAVKLRMRVGVGCVDLVMGQMLGYFEGDNVEPMADTRRAIVRAAAAYAQSLAATSSGDSR